MCYFFIVYGILELERRDKLAKFERQFKGSFEHFVPYVEKSVNKGSASSSLEDRSDYRFDDVRVAVRVFERYSMVGSNRVSLNITIVSKEDNIYVTAITSGGSQAVLFKVNTFGESSFLSNFEKYVDQYIHSQRF